MPICHRCPDVAGLVRLVLTQLCLLLCCPLCRCISYWQSADAGQIAEPNRQQQQCTQQAGLTQQQHTANPQQPYQQESLQHQQLAGVSQQQVFNARSFHTFSSSSSSYANSQRQQQQSLGQRYVSTQSTDSAEPSALSTQMGQLETLQQLDELLQVGDFAASHGFVPLLAVVLSEVLKTALVSGQQNASVEIKFGRSFMQLV